MSRKNIADLFSNLKSEIKDEAKRLLGSEKYPAAAQQINLLEELDSLRDKYPDILQPKQASSAKIASTNINVSSYTPTIIAKADSYPIYYVADGCLHKIGLKRGSEGETYRKIVPITDVATVCEALGKIISQSTTISLSDIKPLLSTKTPEYKIQVTLSALTVANVIESPTRGKYQLPSGGKFDPKSWPDKLAKSLANPRNS